MVAPPGRGACFARRMRHLSASPGSFWSQGHTVGSRAARAVLREVAEYPNSFAPLGPNDERIETDRFTLCIGQGRSWNTVQRQRFHAGEVDDVLEEVRSMLRSRGRTSTQWEVGSSAQPLDLVDLLL